MQNPLDPLQQQDCRSLKLTSLAFLQLFPLLSGLTSLAIWASCFTGILNISSASQQRAFVSTRDDVFKDET